MGIKSFFRKIAKKPDLSFDEVTLMKTCKLPVPEEKGGDPKFYVEFVAERQKDGLWRVFLTSNAHYKQPGSDNYEFSPMSHAAVRKAFEKHGEKPTKNQSLRFETAFLVLREMEEAHLKYNGTAVRPEEPPYHYMAAWRLMPTHLQEVLDDLYKSRKDKGDALPFQKETPQHPPHTP